jgi:hypothetical protein
MTYNANKMWRLKLIWIVLLINSLSNLSYAQQEPYEWVKELGSRVNFSTVTITIPDLFIRGEAINKIHITKNQSMYVSGTFYPNDSIDALDTVYRGFTGASPTPQINNPVPKLHYIARIGLDGLPIWQSFDTTISGVVIRDIVSDSSGNTIILGSGIGQFVFKDSLMSTTSIDYNFFFLLKLDSNDNIIWFKEAKALNYSLPGFSNIVITDSNEILFSFTNRTQVYYEGDTILPPSNPSPSQSSLSILKLDSNGSVIWSESLMPAIHQGQNISTTADDSGNVYVGTYVDGNIPTGNTYTPGGDNLVLFKFDNTGNFAWHQSFGPGGGGSFSELFASTIQIKYSTSENRVFFSGGARSDYAVNYQWRKHWYYFGGNYTVSSPGDSLIQNNHTSIGFFGSFNLDGTLHQVHISEVSNISPYDFLFVSSILEKGDDICYSGTYRGELSYSSNNIGQASAYAPFIIRYSKTNDDFELVNNPNVNGGKGYIQSFAFDENDNIYGAGNLSVLSAVSFGSQPLTNSTPDGGFIYKYRNCDQLQAPYISFVGDSAPCAGPVTLASSDSLNHLYHWLINGSEITGATDTSYITLAPANYSLLIKDGVCEKVSNTISVLPATPNPVNFVENTTSFCSGDSIHILSGGTPNGGYYSSPFVSDSVFSIFQAGIGNHPVSYVYTDSNGCVDSSSLNFLILEDAFAVLFDNLDTLCLSNDTLNLTGGFPSGGQYSGDGVVPNGKLAVNQLDTGIHWLYYSKSNQLGCVAIDSISYYVAPDVAVSLPPMATVCETDNPVLLNGGTPIGGTYSGSGVSGNFFIPQVLNDGIYQITYTVTENGCTKVASTNVQVDGVPVLSMPPLDSICVAANPFMLNHALPLGGSYIGSGIIGNEFSASQAGTGVINIQYAFQNACPADTVTNTVQIIPNPTASAVISDVSCFGLNNGAIVAQVSGGNTPYNFNWDNGDTLNQIQSVLSGQYILTATGEGGCFVTDTFYVAEPTDLVLSLDSLDNLVCNGFSDGKAFTSGSGGTAPYTYLWSDGTTLSNNLALTSGFHQLILTDNNGCEDSLSVFIDELNPIVVSHTWDSVSCFGLADGSASVLATGGGGSFTYLWSTGDTVTSLTNLSSDLYQVTVTDTFNCQRIDSIPLAQPDSLWPSFSKNDISCFGQTDGNVKVNPVGGTGPFLLSWDTGVSQDSIFNLSAGFYSLNIIDANGCQATDSIEIIEPDSLDLSISESQSISCLGDSNGQLAAMPTGGTAPYSFLWSNTQIGDTTTNLPTGIYSVTLTDSRGCTKSSSFNLLEPDALVIQLDSIKNISCYQYTDGVVGWTTIGGTGSVTYSWSNGTNGSLDSALATGSYSITASDMNGCQTDTSILIAEPAEISLSMSANDVSCFGGNDGQATVLALNGQGPYNYSWSNGSSTAINSTLTSSQYLVTVSDSMGCFKIDSVFIDEPTPIIGSYSGINNLCHGDSTGQLSASATGGVAPYTFIWSNGASTDTIDSIAAGTYSVTITDSNACQIDSSRTITEPSALVFSLDSLENLLCYQDSSGYVEINANGGTAPYSYLWDDGATITTRSGLAADTFAITVTDINLCAHDTVIYITEPQPLNVSIDSSKQLVCFGDSTGFIVVEGQGGTGSYNFNWGTGLMSDSLLNLSAGSYQVTVSDSNACVFDTVFIVHESDLLQISALTSPALCNNSQDGSITASGTGGSLPYSYDWTTGSTSDTLSGLAPGSYSLTLTDSIGCVSESTFNVDFQFVAPLPSLPDSTGYCMEDSVLINSGVLSNSYTWSTGAITPTIFVQDTGWYSVNTLDFTGCGGFDSVYVSEYELPVFELGNDTAICIAFLEQGITLSGPSGQSSYLWNTGSLTQSEVVTEFGAYSLTLENVDGCFYSDTLNILSEVCVGISESEFGYEIKLFPNPNRGLFTIEIDNEQSYSYTITNSLGQKVSSGSFQHSTSINMESSAAGLYHISITDNDGNSVVKSFVLN